MPSWLNGRRRSEARYSGNPLAGRNSCAERHDVPVPSRISCHRVRKRVAQSGNDLEQRQICVGQAAADQMRGTVCITCEHTLEIADVFWHPVRDEVGCAPFRFAALILVIQARCDRVVGVMRFDDEVCERKLQLKRPQTTRFTLWRKVCGDHRETEECSPSAQSGDFPPSEMAVQTVDRRLHRH